MSAAPTYSTSRAYLFLTALLGFIALIIGAALIGAAMLGYFTLYSMSLALTLFFGGLATVGVAQIAQATLDTAVATRRMADHICGSQSGQTGAAPSGTDRREPALRAPNVTLR